MNINIDSDDDIVSFAENFGVCTMSRLEYIYKSAGYRSHINLGRFENNLFLEIDIYNNRFQWDWLLQEEIFEEVMREFEFKPSNIYSHSETIIFTYPDDISIVKENKLIETFFRLVVGDIHHFMSHKYGLK